MAIIELQIRREAFVSFFVNEINHQRLRARSVDAFEEIKGKLLQRIECTGATVEPSAGDEASDRPGRPLQAGARAFESTRRSRCRCGNDCAHRS